jgi:hypothetical protein
MKMKFEIDPIDGGVNDQIVFAKLLEAIQVINQMNPPQADPQDVPIPFTPTETTSPTSAMDPIHEDESTDFDPEKYEQEKETEALDAEQEKAEIVANESGPQATLNEARDCARDFIKAHGKEVAVGILKETTGCANLTDAPEDKLGAFVAACEAYEG